MNGEIEQMSNIVISARKALYLNDEIDFSLSKFVLSIRFFFAPKFLVWGAFEVDSVSEWFDTCKKIGLDDIKFVIPTASDSRNLLGYSNTSQGLIICFWKNGKVSCFSPLWKFDDKQNGWSILYKERVVRKIRKDEIAFIDKTDEFKNVLSDIGKFSNDIGFPYFSDVFHKAHDALSDSTFIELEQVPSYVPDNFKGIYYAVETADVFGAMGSWNDSPPCYAHEMGLDKEYNKLSDQLLHQVRYHLMYVTNECWQKINQSNLIM